MKQKGIIYILLSALFFSIMAASVKSVPDLPLSEKIFFRNFVGLVAVFFTVVRMKIPLKVHNPRLMLMRALLGLTGVGLYYAALELLPLADAVILNKLSPFFVMIFASFFLKEKIGKYQKLALVIGVLGALLVIKPTFDVSILPALLALLSAAFAGAAYTVIRKLTEYDQPTVIVFYFCLISSVVLVPFMVIEGFVVPNFKELLGLLSIGISALLAQLFMTNAYKYAPASELSVYTYVNIVFSALWGFLLWTEIPDFISIIGGLLIISAAFVNYFSKRMKTVK
ncbi:DMT family transporter [Fusibacter bizertensis]|uniref:DMT family transporter n=1 Tax=Fusibacter bizertensis TaxID=1488331 RepID=A0ABT6NH80_9FIRM|nr:DMT family transporter [Fusibacter bizertensis]MDH8679766.1 DMT family transporter [Fusibacter bizertensis]